MNNHTKAAYRYLLYVAMLDIRNHCQSRGKESRNPFEWRRQYRRSRAAGAIADWLHNLAEISAAEFVGFDEQQFWKEHAGLCRRLPSEGFERYRQTFDEIAAGKFSIR